MRCYGVILIPVASAVLALCGYGIYFKEGVAVSCACIIAALASKQHMPTLWFLVVALLLSVGGDWFLSHRHGVVLRFVYGIALFFAAHIGFLLYSLKNGKLSPKILLLILLPYLFFFVVALYPAIDNTLLMFAVLCYLLVSCFSLTAATGLQKKMLVRLFFITGIVALVFSDTIIAITEFVHCHSLAWLIMPTYYLAHILITLSVLSNFAKKTTVTRF